MEKQYIMTERAHFMCPNMNFGILVRLNGAFDEKKLFDMDIFKDLAEKKAAMEKEKEDSRKKFFLLISTNSIIYQCM